MIDEYLATVNSTDKAYISKVRNYLIECSEIFAELGITEPTAPDFERLRDLLSQRPGKRGKKRSKGVIQDMVNHAKKYHQMKAGKQQIMIEQQATKRGRKVKPDGEKRSVKYCIYLTQEVFEGLKVCAAINHQDMPDIIFNTLKQLVDDNAEAVSAYQDFLAKFGVAK